MTTDLTSAATAMLAAREYLRRAQQSTFDAVSSSGKVDAMRIETEQRRLHGLAWTATVVEGMEALLAWRLRIAARGAPDADAALVVRVGFGEYLAQILGGLPMSQNELVRPGDLDAQDAAGLLRADPAVSDLLESGNSVDNRAALTRRLAEGWYPDESLGEDTLDSIRAQIRRFTQERIAPYADRKSVV